MKSTIQRIRQYERLASAGDAGAAEIAYRLLCRISKQNEHAEITAKELTNLEANRPSFWKSSSWQPSWPSSWQPSSWSYSAWRPSSSWRPSWRPSSWRPSSWRPSSSSWPHYGWPSALDKAWVCENGIRASIAKLKEIHSGPNVG